MTDAPFIAATKRSEKRTVNITTAAVINPRDPEHWGRVVITGAMKREAIAWLPGAAHGRERHYGWAHGYGYDKDTAAMAGASFTAPDGTVGRIVDSGEHWDDQLRAAGFIVIQTC